MSRRVSMALAPVFALTGLSALILQVVWQRMISLHNGVDLASTTTVVAAFLGGLGIGSLLGGWLADRLGPRRSLVAFACSNAAIGTFAWFSHLLFYDLYQQIADQLDGTLATFLFNAGLLAVPTTLMGLSLPLVARAVTSRIADAGRLIGRLYGINTVGGAVGAAVGGWYLLGTFGFVTTTRIAGTLNLIAAVVVLTIWRTVGRAAPEPSEPTGSSDAAGVPASATAAGGGGWIWPWFGIYALTGAVALGLNQLFFRLIDAEMRSNSYSFAHVLTLYLVLFGLGSALASRLVRPGRDPRRWFLRLQFGVGLSAAFALVMLVEVLPLIGFDDVLRRYFLGDGYNGGFGDTSTLGDWARIGLVYLAVPLGLMGVPVFLMGASFPFVQSLVADRVDTLGRRTGLLIFANVVGNVAGTLAVGFVLIDALGTAGTFRLLTGALGVAGVGAALLAVRPARRVVEATVAVGLLAAVLLATPSNVELWAFLHGVDEDGIDVAEDHSCATALRRVGDSAILTINGSTQNGYPFTDFHVLIGLVPALVVDKPENALAIGFGAGSTTYGMLAVDSLDSVVTVELCGGAYDLAHLLADEGRYEMQRMFADPRYEAIVGDGRKHLLTDDRLYDVITVDTLRPTSAFSGSLYSTEFYELLNERLAPGGVIAQWVPTTRVVNTAAQVFPYITTYVVPSYGGTVLAPGSAFMIASREPVDLSPEVLLPRLERVPVDHFTPTQRESLELSIAQESRQCVQDGTILQGLSSEDINADLRPRDEYFINNGAAPQLPRC